MKNENKKQLDRIKNILVLIAKEYNNKAIKVNELTKYFSDEDLPVLYGLLNDLEKNTSIVQSSQQNNPFELKATPVFELEYEEITPYNFLGLEEKEYTNEELLEAVSKKIYSKRLIKDKKYKSYQIDKILDAYNELKK